VARQVGDVCTAFQAYEMVIFPDSMATAMGLTFTIGQIT
jgi:hypothetical protein